MMHALGQENIFVRQGGFHALGNAFHRGGRLDGIFAARRLTAQHDSVGAVEDRVADIGNLRAGRTGIGRHGLKHLRRDNDGFARRVAFLDDVLLNDRDVFSGNFDAEIAARNHDPVGDRNDLIDVVNAGFVFDLGNDLHVSAVLLDQRANFFDVVGALNEGRGNEVHIVFDAEDDILLVLFADGGKTESNARGSDAFSCAHLAAVQDRGDDVLIFDLIDENLNETVAEQEFIAGLNFGVKFFVADGDVSFIAGLVGLGEGEFVAGGEHDRAVFKFAEAHFGTFGVENERNDLLGLLGGVANAVDAHEMTFVIAVREVEARAVHAVFDELLDDTGRVGRGTLRADDLRLLQHDFASQRKKNFLIDESIIQCFKVDGKKNFMSIGISFQFMSIRRSFESRNIYLSPTPVLRIFSTA